MIVLLALIAMRSEFPRHETSSLSKWSSPAGIGAAGVATGASHCAGSLLVLAGRQIREALRAARIGRWRRHDATLSLALHGCLQATQRNRGQPRLRKNVRAAWGEDFHSDRGETNSRPPIRPAPMLRRQPASTFWSSNTISGSLLKRKEAQKPRSLSDNGKARSNGVDQKIVLANVRLQTNTSVRELQLYIPVKIQILQASLHETAARSSKLFYYSTQSLAKWDPDGSCLCARTGIEVVSACGTHQEAHRFDPPS